MRKVIVFVDSTVDGFMADPKGDLGWMVSDPVVDHDLTTDLRRRVDTVLTGRATYQSLESVWPVVAMDPARPAEEVDFARWMLDVEKVVFSRTLASVSMRNSRLATGDVHDEVASLKSRAGKDIVLVGGAGTVQTFVAEGLVDEYWLKISPIAIGSGRPVFGAIARPVKLKPFWSRVYDSGVVGVRFHAV